MASVEFKYSTYTWNIANAGMVVDGIPRSTAYSRANSTYSLRLNLERIVDFEIKNPGQTGFGVKVILQSVNYGTKDFTIMASSSAYVDYELFSGYMTSEGDDSATILLFSDQNPVIECDEDHPCPSGQKCVNGECVDCEENQATHFRFRVEFDRETAVPDLGGNVTKIEIPPRSISSMDDTTVIDTPSYANLKCLVRAIPCDASGNPKPYNGNASFMCNPQSNTEQGFIGYVSGSEAGWKHTGMINSSADGITGYQYTRIEVLGVDESAVVYEEGCGGYVAEEPVQIPVTGEPPVIPPPEKPDEPEVLPPPSEPLPPDDWPEPWEPPYTPPINPIPPTEPTPPEEPATGCECEIYLAQYIGSRLVWLVNAVLNVKDTIYNFTLAAYDIFNALIQFLSSVYSNFSLFLVEFLRLIYQTVLHIVTVYQNEQFKNREKLDEVVDELKTFNTKFAEFADNYEPVQIENEYRTQSHRIIDNLDSTLNKL